MLALLAFAVVAGAGTAVSPCVLPVLPIVLSAGTTGGRRRPLGIVTGLVLSFTFATVGAVYLIDALGLPDGLLRTVAIVALLVFGVSLAIPSLAARIEGYLTRLSGRGPRVRAKGEGFGSGIAVGASLGLVYAPCAGPILAGVITVSAAQPFTAGRVYTALAYGLGSGIVLYALMLGGRRITRRLSARSGRLQQALGGVMVAVAVAMLFNLDTRFQTVIASHLPSFLVNPSGGLERSHIINKQLTSLRGGSRTCIRETPNADPQHLPVLCAAPELRGGQRWFNTAGGRPLTLAELRAQNRVVLIDFWTYTCINCIRTFPTLRAWNARYASRGLTIVGVHAPEFPFERNTGNVRSAIGQNGLRYPIVQDNKLAIWNAYGNRYWPSEYLIDAHGRLRYVKFGEGGHERTEAAIRALLAESGHGGLGRATQTPVQSPAAPGATPESYLGAQRAQRFENGPIVPGRHVFGGGRPRLARDALAYRGEWTIRADAATAGRRAKLFLRFSARKVFIVASGNGRRMQVLLDGHRIPAADAGPDVRRGSLLVRGQRLYRVVDLPAMQTHTLELDPQPGVTGFAFTFG